MNECEEEKCIGQDCPNYYLCWEDGAGEVM